MAEADKRQNLIPADVVESRWQELSSDVRTKLLAFPAPAAAAVAGLGSVADVERELRKLVYQTLRELAGQTDDAEPGSNA